jgi:DNA-binding MarR family transcriptional regulator
MTWLVDRLEERGLVERRMLPADRRVKAVALTPSGAKAKAELIERLYEPPAELLALDRDTLQKLHDVVASIKDAMPPATIAPFVGVREAASA